MLKKIPCLLISDFNIENFAGLLNNSDTPPRMKAAVAPFGQVMPLLMDGDSPCWKSGPDFAVVWTTPESVVQSFSEISAYKKSSIDLALEEVDRFSQALISASGNVRSLFVPMWVTPSYHRGFGMLDLRNGIGMMNTLMRMNVRLSENLDRSPNIYLLNTQKWIEAAGKRAFSEKLWYMSKVVFGNEVFLEAVKDIQAALSGIRGESKKLVVLDLDDTLWGGVVGDTGWRNITLGGHDPFGEAFVDFQRSLKALTNRGILLGVVSKNEESVALEAIDRHPEMVLRKKDLAGWKINWLDKAKNIADLAGELNLGVSSVVFIDNDPAERDRVREALPEVLVPEWPDNPMLYTRDLLGLRCFDSPSITAEDTARTAMYATERKRKHAKKELSSIDDWLKGIDISVTVEELHDGNLKRAAQLFNKTNQMNLTTRRMSESELTGWLKAGDRKIWTFRVADKFGDSGLTGIVGLEVDKKIARITDFVLSCRVIGRRIEETMLYTAIRYAQSAGIEEVRARYAPTPKNKPCLDFWKRSGFRAAGGNDRFLWRVRDEFRAPDFVTIR
ncbi:MAG: HAD-IIIC family phosphatase [Candidatus Omnitrophota bacterium]